VSALLSDFVSLRSLTLSSRNFFSGEAEFFGDEGAEKGDRMGLVVVVVVVVVDDDDDDDAEEEEDDVDVVRGK